MSSTPSEGRNLIPYVLGGVALVALLAVIVVSLSGSDEGEPSTAPVEVSGAPLPPLVDGTADEAVGLPIPEVFGTDLEGDDIAIQANGTPQAIIMLAHWCGHCQNEVAQITDFLDGGGEFPEGVDVISVSSRVQPVSGNYPPSKWLGDEGWPFPVMRDDENDTVFQAFGSSGTPFWIFVDADGTVASRASGEIGVDGAISAMDQLLAAEGGDTGSSSEPETTADSQPTTDPEASTVPAPAE